MGDEAGASSPGVLLPGCLYQGAFTRLSLPGCLYRDAFTGMDAWSVSDQSEALWLALRDLGGLLPGLFTGVAQGLGIRGFRAVLERLMPRGLYKIQGVSVFGQFLTNVMACGVCSGGWAGFAQVYPQVAHSGCGVLEQCDSRSVRAGPRLLEGAKCLHMSLPWSLSLSLSLSKSPIRPRLRQRQRQRQRTTRLRQRQRLSLPSLPKGAIMTRRPRLPETRQADLALGEQVSQVGRRCGFGLNGGGGCGRYESFSTGPPGRRPALRRAPAPRPRPTSPSAAPPNSPAHSGRWFRGSRRATITGSRRCRGVAVRLWCCCSAVCWGIYVAASVFGACVGYLRAGVDDGRGAFCVYADAGLYAAADRYGGCAGGLARGLELSGLSVRGAAGDAAEGSDAEGSSVPHRSGVGGGDDGDDGVGGVAGAVGCKPLSGGAEHRGGADAGFRADPQLADSAWAPQ